MLNLQKQGGAKVEQGGAETTRPTNPLLHCSTTTPIGGGGVVERSGARAVCSSLVGVERVEQEVEH